MADVALPDTVGPPRMPVERPTTIYLNDQEWATVQTTPVDLEDWATGYLFGEGVVSYPEAVTGLVVDEDRGLVWIDLAPGTEPAGEFAPVQHDLQVSPQRLLQWMSKMLGGASLYTQWKGIHAASAVRVDTGEQLIREDIGRHNAVDKAIGACLRQGWPPDQVVLLTSGRISYEMCTRLARFGAAVGVSRTAATDQAYYLAMQLGIELVGYVRTLGSLTVYTEGTRIMGRGSM